MQPYYQVQVFSGNPVPGGMTSQEKDFKGENLREMRTSALACALITINQNQDEIDDPSLINEKPELIPMLNAMSVDVYFIEDTSKPEESAKPIFGTEVHEVLTGLHEEALFYVKNDLIKKEELISIYQNYKREDEDPDNQPFYLASDADEMPDDYDYYEIQVLPYELEPILDMLQ